MYAICEQRATEFLDGYLAFIDSPSPSVHEVKFFERRRKPRLNDSLPVRIWGIDTNDEVLSFDSHLDNISSSGLFLRIPRQLKISSQISLVVRLINDSGVMAAIRGRVLRDEPQLDGSRGIAVKITEHSFL
jgi:Tfp pilus assembly protein PilZ